MTGSRYRIQAFLESLFWFGVAIVLNGFERLAMLRTCMSIFIKLVTAVLPAFVLGCASLPTRPLALHDEPAGREIVTLDERPPTTCRRIELVGRNSNVPLPTSGRLRWPIVQFPRRADSDLVGRHIFEPTQAATRRRSYLRIQTLRIRVSGFRPLLHFAPR